MDSMPEPCKLVPPVGSTEQLSGLIGRGIGQAYLTDRIEVSNTKRER